MAGVAAGRRGGSGLQLSEDLAVEVARVLVVYVCVPACSEAHVRKKRVANVRGCAARHCGEMGASSKRLGLPRQAGLPAGVRAVMRANSTATGL
jgi:hypothetical protein